MDEEEGVESQKQGGEVSQSHLARQQVRDREQKRNGEGTKDGGKDSPAEVCEAEEFDADRDQRLGEIGVLQVARVCIGLALLSGEQRLGGRHVIHLVHYAAESLLGRVVAVRRRREVDGVDV